MSATETTVTTVDALLAPVAENGVERIIIGGRLAGAPYIRLSPGRGLRGNDDSAFIALQAGVDGVQSSADSVCNLHLYASPEMRAIFKLPCRPRADSNYPLAANLERRPHGH